MTITSLANFNELLNMKFIVIVTHGRSGSTVVQKAVGSLPNSVIRGESGGVMIYLGMAAWAAMKFAGKTKGNEEVGPWAGNGLVSRELVKEQLRTMILTTFLGVSNNSRYAGFKEIRFDSSRLPGESLTQWCEGMEWLFPDIYFVLNIRNVEDTAKSSWFREMADPQETLRSIHKRLLALHDWLQTTGRKSVLLNHDTWKGNPDDLRRIFQMVEDEPIEYLFDEAVNTRLWH